MRNKLKFIVVGVVPMIMIIIIISKNSILFSDCYYSTIRSEQQQQQQQVHITSSLLLVDHNNTKSIVDYDDDAFTFINATTTLHNRNQNKSCILVGCHTMDAVGYEPYTNFYVNNYTYPVRITSFEKLQHNNNNNNNNNNNSRPNDATPHWCRIPSVLETLRQFPKSRVVYIDLDTRTDPTTWCNMMMDPQLLLPKEDYIIMNSVHRRPREKDAGGQYFVQGTQVQSNIFVVSSEGPMKRWEALYQPNITLYDQGVIHIQERGQLCGVPGWIACHNNMIENRCHCTGQSSLRAKEQCIKNLFELPRCPLRVQGTKQISNI